MAFDVQKWLVEEMGFTAEEATTLAPQFSSRADKLEKGVLRQSDYSRQMNDLKKLQDQLAESNDKLNEELAEFATMQANGETVTAAAREQIEKLEADKLRLTQRLTRAAEELGKDPKELLGDVEPLKKVEPVAFDDKQLREDLRTQVGGVASYMLRLNAKLPGIMREHKALTGEDLDVDAFIDGIQQDIAKGKTENIDPVKRWEAQYQIPTKRTEASQKKYEADIKAAEERGRMAERSEQAIPGTPRAGEHAPVLKGMGESKLQRPQPSTRLQGAITSLATGKYRDKGHAA